MTPGSKDNNAVRQHGTDGYLGDIMAEKTDTEVVIGGKVLTLRGSESEEYLQRVAAYINGKIAEYSKIESFARQSSDLQSILLELNIADDYFKAKKQLEILQEELDNKDKELYDAKHNLITTQIKLKSMDETLHELQKENNENQKKIIKLETKLGISNSIDEARSEARNGKKS